MYRIKLQCRCGHQSDWKEYDVTLQKMRQIINVAQRALMTPHYLVCPKCNGILTVKPVVQSFTKGGK
jgi:uncharacterized protein with PIN domain